MKILFLLFTLTIYFFSLNPIFGQSDKDIIGQSDKDIKRRLSIDSSYSDDKYSNRAIGDFGVELYQLNSALHDSISLDSGFTRFGWTIIHSLFTEIYLKPKFSLAYHEFGHGTRMAAGTNEPEYLYVNNFTTSEINAAKPYKGFFSYFFAGLTMNTNGGIARGSGKKLFSLKANPDGWTSNDWNFISSAGGLNNEMFFSEKLEISTLHDGGHLSYLIPYISGKQSAADYVKKEKSGVFGSSSDVKNIINFSKYNDYGITLDDIESGSNESLQLSIATYQFLFGYYDYIVNNEKKIEAWNLGGILLPNTNFYINRQGLSKKYSTGFIFSERLLFRFANETIYKGESLSETSLGFRYSNSNYTIDFENISTNNLGYLTYNMSDSSEFTVGVSSYDLLTLYGERNITKTGDDFKDNQVWFKLSYVY